MPFSSGAPAVVMVAIVIGPLNLGPHLTTRAWVGGRRLRRARWWSLVHAQFLALPSRPLSRDRRGLARPRACSLLPNPGSATASSLATNSRCSSACVPPGLIFERSWYVSRHIKAIGPRRTDARV
jgi:hypothetical protein